MKKLVLAFAFASLLPLAANAAQLTQGQPGVQTSAAQTTVAYNAERTSASAPFDQAQNASVDRNVGSVNVTFRPTTMNGTCVDWDAGVCDSVR